MFTRLSPKLDIVFKLLFTGPGTEEMLISLLSAVIRPLVAIRSVLVLNPETPKELSTDRAVFLDLRVQLADGRQVDVEMQSQSRPGIRKRMLYHWARLYAGQLARGMDYAALQPCICIFLLDYRELRSDRFHSTFRVLEVHDHEPLADQFEVHLVELPKLPKPGSVEWIQERKLADWGRFFSAQDDRELEELAMSDPVFGKAKGELDRLSGDPLVQYIAREREYGHMMEQMHRIEARNEGLAEGEARGRAEGKLETERSVLVRLLEHRFGPLDEGFRTRIDQADTERLSEWVLRVVSSESIEAVFDEEP